MRALFIIHYKSRVSKCSFVSKVISQSMKDFLLEVKKRAVIGIVGGSDLVKMQEQMGAGDGENIAAMCCTAATLFTGARLQ